MVKALKRRRGLERMELICNFLFDFPGWVFISDSLTFILLVLEQSATQNLPMKGNAVSPHIRGESYCNQRRKQPIQPSVDGQEELRMGMKLLQVLLDMHHS